MKRLFLFFCIALCAGSAMSEEKTISPTVCGITVGKTTNKEIIANGNSIIGLYTIPININETSVILLGDFLVEGFHMSLMTIEFYNDTVYKVKFYEQCLQTNGWKYYKDFAYRMRDEYTVLQDITNTTGLGYNTDSLQLFYKTDGRTNLVFAANPTLVTYELTNKHLENQLYAEMADDINNYVSGVNSPNYDPKNKVTAVAGVDLGLPRTNVEDSFRRRGQFLKREGSLTHFSNVNFAGSNYTHAILYFQYDETKKTQVFAAVQFEKNFYNWHKEEAEMMYKSICESFNSKYTNGRIVKNEDGDRMMTFGMLEDNYQEGKIPPIIVSLNLGLSRGGDKYYYVTVGYFEGRMTHVTSDDL